MAEQKADGYSTKYRFTEKKFDESTCLYYFGARYYDPRISICFCVDPLTRTCPELNPYQFTINTPKHAIDLDCKEAKVVVTQIGKTSEGLKIINSFELLPNSVPGPAKFEDYANQSQYGTRGTLKVIQFLDPMENSKSQKVSKIEGLNLTLAIDFFEATSNGIQIEESFRGLSNDKRSIPDTFNFMGDKVSGKDSFMYREVHRPN